MARTRRLKPLATLAGVLWAALILTAQERPLPDQGSFLAEARKHLEVDSALQSSYMYVETRRELRFDRRGKTKEERVQVFESYPGLPGEGRWHRLVSENGVPVSAADLAKQDRERRKNAEEAARRLSRQSEADRARQRREWEERRREHERILDDVFSVFDIRMLGREEIEGHDTISLSLTPRPDAKPRTREGGQMRHFKVNAWISERDHELVRVHAEAIEPVSFGFGVLARLHRGAEVSFLRRKVNGEVWLPAVSSYQGSARVGMVWTTRRAGSSEYSGYRKFTVDTATTYSTPR
jgi:hypothetical protein